MMMDSRAKRITAVVSAYDSTLFAIRTVNGMLQIHRKMDKLKVSNHYQTALLPGEYHPQFILALTDTWKLTGKPVDWGIEPIMAQIRSMDAWAKEDLYSDMCKRRARENELKDQHFKSEVRASADELRRDFAQATNDINTSTLEKVDRRRKNGNH